MELFFKIKRKLSKSYKNCGKCCKIVQMSQNYKFLVFGHSHKFNQI